MSWPYTSVYNPYVFPYTNPYVAPIAATNSYSYRTLIFVLPNNPIGIEIDGFVEAEGYSINSYNQTTAIHSTEFIHSVLTQGNADVSSSNVDISTATATTNTDIDSALSAYGAMGFRVYKITLIGNNLIMYTLEKQAESTGIYAGGYNPGYIYP